MYVLVATIQKVASFFSNSHIGKPRFRKALNSDPVATQFRPSSDPDFRPSMSVCVCTYVCMYVHTYEHTDVCMYMCVYVGMCACMYVCMYACMFVCIVWMFVHSYVFYEGTENRVATGGAQRNDAMKSNAIKASPLAAPSLICMYI